MDRIPAGISGQAENTDEYNDGNGDKFVHKKKKYLLCKCISAYDFIEPQKIWILIPFLQ